MDHLTNLSTITTVEAIAIFLGCWVLIELSYVFGDLN